MEARYPWKRRSIWAFAHQADDPLKSYHIGGKLWFKAEEVEAWIQRRTLGASDFDKLAAEILVAFDAKAKGL